MRRLLKSWAMPPASRPTASIFCAWRSCASMRATSVTLSNVTASRLSESGNALTEKMAGCDPVVGVLELAGVEHLAGLDDLPQAVDERRRNRRKDLRSREADDVLDREAGRLLARPVRIAEMQRVLLDAEDVERGLHVLDDLVLQPQLLEESASLLQLVRVAQHRTDELRHQARRLDGKLVERVRLAAENGEHSDHVAVAMERRADERPDAEPRADVSISARVGRRV